MQNVFILIVLQRKGGTQIIDANHSIMMSSYDVSLSNFILFNFIYIYVGTYHKYIHIIQNANIQLITYSALSNY